MHVFPFHELAANAQRSAISRYWLDALYLIEPDYDVLDYIERHNLAASTTLESLACTLLCRSS